jgi:hypothetical protein
MDSLAKDISVASVSLTVISFSGILKQDISPADI